MLALPFLLAQAYGIKHEHVAAAAVHTAAAVHAADGDAAGAVHAADTLHAVQADLAAIPAQDAGGARAPLLPGAKREAQQRPAAVAIALFERALAEQGADIAEELLLQGLVALSVVNYGGQVLEVSRLFLVFSHAIDDAVTSAGMGLSSGCLLRLFLLVMLSLGCLVAGLPAVCHV
jgi:hypothetical protein